MAEVHPGTNLEKLEQPELEAPVEQHLLSEHGQKDHEAHRQNSLESSRDQIDQLAVAAKSVGIGEQAPKEVNDHVAVNKELKDLAYNRILTRTRKDLSLPNRLLSKFTHQPVIDKLSQIGEKTFARPSGVLGGSLTALLGTSTLLYTAKHYGFRYNFFFIVLLFAAGFVLGLLIEMLSAGLRHHE